MTKKTNTCHTFHNKKFISGKVNSYEGLRGKNVSVLITTCWQLSKVHFSARKMSDFLILNWGGRLTRTEQLIDCGLVCLDSLMIILGDHYVTILLA